MRIARVIGPNEGSRRPFGAPSLDVLERGYVIEEFLLEGEAVAYGLAEGTEPTSDGRWSRVEAGVAPYRTRLLVVRPSSPERFNGTVIVNWANVSAGYESAAPSSGEAYEGYAWVTVSAQEVGLYGMPAGVVRGNSATFGAVPPLVDHDPQRYRTLMHPGDAGAYEMFTQAGRALGGAREGDVDPLGGLVPRRLVASGGSQSAMRLVAYYNAVHQHARVFDGFLLSVWEARAPRPEEGPISFGGYRTLVRDDLGTPVLVVNSEFEAPNCAVLSMADNHSFRLWEVTGTPHGVARQRASDGGGSDRGVNTLSYRPVYEAATRAMHSWLADGTAPPSQPRIEFEASARGPVIRRDARGNGIGGIRLPELEAPTAEYHGVGFGTGRAPLFGMARPFAEDVLRELYPTPASFLDPWRAAVDALVATGALRPEDAAAMRARADDELPAHLR